MYTTKKWYQTWWGRLLLIIFLGPIGAAIIVIDLLKNRAPSDPTLKLEIVKNKEIQKLEKNKNKQLQRQEKLLIPKKWTSLMHISGLDLPEKTNVEVTLNSEFLTIEAIGKKYKISVDKIKNYQLQDTKDISEITKASVGKGIVGAALFGTSGAIIGASSGKKEKVVNKTEYVIISFENSNKELTTMIISDNSVNQVFSNSISLWSRLIDVVKKETTEIEL